MVDAVGRRPVGPIIMSGQDTELAITEEKFKDNNSGITLMICRLLKQLCLNLVCFLVALVLTTRGVCYLDMVQIYETSVDALAPTLIASAIGTIVGSNLMGVLLRGWPLGSHLFEALGLLLASVNLSLFPFGPDVSFLIVMSFLAGVGLAMARNGATAICLMLWDGTSYPKAPFVHSLFLFQAAGNAFAPFISKPFLSEDHETRNDTDFSQPLEDESIGVSLVSDDTSDLELLFPLIGTFGLSLALCFIIQAFLRCLFGEGSLRSKKVSRDSKLAMESKVSKKKGWKWWLLLLLGSLFYLLDFGMQMGIANFLIPSVVKGELHLSKAEGADLQTIYFTAQLVSRILSIGLAFLLSPMHFIVLGLSAGLISSVSICLVYQSSHWALKVSYATLGLCMGSMSGNTMMWMEQYMKVTATVSGVVMTASAMGSLTSTLLFAPLVESHPGILMLYQSTIIVVYVAIFGIGTIVGRSMVTSDPCKEAIFKEKHREPIFEDENTCQLLAFTRL